jgi:lipopolysaccharide/colanic/teichoic acid biosynthesis glycosyltransferase
MAVRDDKTGPADADGARYRRVEMTEELYRRFATTGGLGGHRRSLRFWRKKYAWIVVVGGANLFKRTLDLIVSTLMLIALLPLFVVVAVLVKAYDRGPLLFWQMRVGRWGREFAFPKFRSMVTDAEALKQKLLDKSDHEDSITFKMKRDPRITPVGRLLRKFSIDELPQLWCVLKGDMSLVGPRPPVPAEVEQYTLAERRRLDVKPGLTCIWQVSGRGDIPFDRQVQLDVQYIESRSFWLDLKLLLKTIPAVLLGRGAY